MSVKWNPICPQGSEGRRASVWDLALSSAGPSTGGRSARARAATAGRPLSNQPGTVRGHSPPTRLANTGRPSARRECCSECRGNQQGGPRKDARADTPTGPHQLQRQTQAPQGEDPAKQGGSTHQLSPGSRTQALGTGPGKWLLRRGGRMYQGQSAHGHRAGCQPESLATLQDETPPPEEPIGARQSPSEPIRALSRSKAVKCFSSSAANLCL